MTPRRLSLIMCTLGRTDCMWRLLDSLKSQSSEAFELIVVDQNPLGFLDAFIAAAGQHVDVVHLRSEPGLSRARNVGIAHARGDVLAFPDDDCWYPPMLVADVLARFDDHPEIDVFTCRTTDETGRDSNGRFLQTTSAIDRDNVWYSGNSNGLFVRLQAARAIGGFSEELGVGSGTQFGSGEESDFVLRALASSYRAIYLADLHTHHDQVDTCLDDKALKRAVLYSWGFGRTLRRNRYPLAFAALRSARSMVASFLSLLKADPRRARFKLVWARGIMSGYLAPTPQTGSAP